MSAIYMTTADPGFSVSGTWSSLSTGTLVFSNAYYYAGPGPGNGSNIARWHFTGLSSGVPYLAGLAWFAFVNRSTAVPWKIYNSDFDLNTNLGTVLADSNTYGTLNQQLLTVGPSGVGPANTGYFDYLAPVTPSGSSLTIMIYDNVPNNYIIADAARLQLMTDPIYYNTRADGNWNAIKTWLGGQIPGSGNNCVLYNNVVVNNDTTIGDGSNDTQLSVTPGGSLTISGCTFTLRGSGYIHGNNVDSLILTPINTTPATLQMYGNSGSPGITMSDGRLSSLGTSSGLCTIKTMPGSAGNAYIVHQPADTSGPYFNCTYTNFTNLGSGVVSSMKNNYAGQSVNFPNNTFIFDNCTFSGCGPPYFTINTTDGTGQNKFTNTKFLNPLSTASLGCFVLLFQGHNGSGTRLLSNCIFEGRAQLLAPLDLYISKCIFLDTLNSTTNPDIWTTCSGCYFSRNTDDATELIVAGSLNDNYFYITQTGANACFLTTSTASTEHTYNIADYGGSGVAPCFWLGETEEGGGFTYLYEHNIGFASGPGCWGTYINMNNNTAYPESFSRVRHNTFIGSGQVFLSIGSATTPTGSIQEVKSNIFYNRGSSAGAYGFDNILTGTDLITNQAPPNAFITNCWYNLAHVPSGTFVTVAPIVAGATTCTDNTVYYSPMSGSIPPGSGDLQNTDPLFYDSTRNILTWDKSLGGPGTLDSALGRIRSDTSLISNSLNRWVRAGYGPTNSSLKMASYAGDTTSIDANGAAWPGGSPGIGAMAFVPTFTGVINVSTNLFFIGNTIFIR